MTRSRTRALLAAVGAAAVLETAWAAQPASRSGVEAPGAEAPPATVAPPAETETPARSSQGGLRVVRDPVTGELVPNPGPEQAGAVPRLRAAAARSTSGLRPFLLEAGGRGVNLRGRFHSALRVAVAPDGSLHVLCTLAHPGGEPSDEPHRHDDGAPVAAPHVEADAAVPPSRHGTSDAAPVALPER